MIEFSHKGKSYSVRSYVPVRMEFVHQKSFLRLGHRRAWAVHGGQFHSALAIQENPVSSLLGRRNHRASWLDDCGDWILLGLQQGWQDLLIYMHRYGIPQIAVFTDRRAVLIKEKSATFWTTR